jgi:hypothetical protein
MIQIHVTLNGVNYLLPDNSFPQLAEIEQYIQEKFKILISEFPNEKMDFHWNEGKVILNAADPVLYRANVLGNETSEV